MIKKCVPLLLSIGIANANPSFFEKSEIDYFHDVKKKEEEVEVKEEKKPEPKVIQKSENLREAKIDPEDRWMLKYKNSVWAKKMIGPDGQIYTTLPPREAIEAVEAMDDKNLTEAEKREKIEAYLQYQQQKIAKLNKAVPIMMQSAADLSIITPDDFVVNPNTLEKQILDQNKDVTNPHYTIKQTKINENQEFADVASQLPGEINSDVVVLLFYDFNCGHCQKQMPYIEEFYKRNKTKMEFKGFYTGPNIRDYIKESSFRTRLGNQIPFKTWPSFYENKKKEKRSYHEDFNVSGTPTIIFLNLKTKRKFVVNDSNVGIKGFENILKSMRSYNN